MAQRVSGVMPTFERYSIRRYAWEAFLTVFVGYLLAFTWMFADISAPNERSRVYLATALVDQGSVEIDTQVARWGKIYDLATRDGRYYSDKAPGSSMLGAVVYGIARMFTEPSEWTIQELINLFRTWLMLPISLIGFLFLRRILEFLGLDPPAVDIASLAWILGTAAFHYGAAYFGHQIVAVALLASLYCLMKGEDYALDRRRGVGGWMFAAGAAAGLAGLTEYQAVIVAGLLLGYVVTSTDAARNKGAVPFIAGAVPFAVVLLWYNDAAFGGPFELSYHYLVDEKLREIHGQGIAGVTIPTWESFNGSMFSLHRGLFGTSPLFLAIFPGFYFLWRAGWVRLTVVIAATFLYFVAFVSSSNMWFAGWGFGPRLLVPAMGMWAIPVAFAVHYALAYPWTEGVVKGLAAAQILYHQIVVAFFPELPETAENPLADVVDLMWREGVTSPNLGHRLFGLEGKLALAPLGVGVLVALGIVLGRGTWNLRWYLRALVAGMAFATLLVCATVAASVDGGWTQQDEVKWMKLVKRWEAREPPR